MCTAIFRNGTLARTVDRDGSLDEHFTVVREDYAGGVIRGDYGEIWIDGLNRRGLTAALLNYRKELTDEIHTCREDEVKIHPARLIPHLLRSCADTLEAAEMLEKVKLAEDMPAMYPHYIIGDLCGRCIVYENGKIYENPLRVLANAPSFDEQCENLRALRSDTPSWDHTSESRFIRAAWLNEHTDEPETAAEYFALLDTLSVPKGMDPRKNYRTLLKTVMSATDGTYSYADEKSRTVKCVKIGDCGSFRVSSSPSSI